MRIVFFGSPPAAIPSLAGILEAGHTVEMAVTQPDKPAGRGRALKPSAVKVFAAGRGLPVLEPARIRKDDAARERIIACGADIHVVVAYGQILPSGIIYAPRFHSVNVHFSLLPKYRGASPVQWAILRGEAETGVTIFELDEKMDEGDVLSSEATEILPRDTARDLETRLAEIGARLLVKTLADIADVRKIPQDHAAATLAPKIRKEDGLVDWTEGAAIIDRKVRAFDPWPGAFSGYKGKRIRILRGHPLDSAAAGPSAGTILAVSKDGLDVACGEGGVFRIEELKPEGRNAMSAYAFSLGALAGPGEVFSPPVPGYSSRM